MKRIASLVAALAISLCLLPACGKATGTQDSGPTTPTVTEAHDAVALGPLVAGEGAEALAAGVQDGSNVPSELRFYVANGYDDTVFDQEVILSAWQALYNLRVDASAPITDVQADDGTRSFSFVWPDDTAVTFAFETNEYASMADGTLYRVEDPASVGTALGLVTGYLDRMYAASADTATEMGELDGTTFGWDIDGDGTFEPFTVAFHDNGDEAPSAIEISGTVAGEQQSAWIDGAYGITNLSAGTDERGAFLEMSYLQGDYYAHDTEATCTLRVVDGQLVVEGQE